MSQSERGSIRAVMDTNIIVSGIIAHGTPHRLLAWWHEKRFVAVISPQIIAEIERVLAYPHIRGPYNLTDADVEAALDSLRRDAVVVEGQLQVQTVAADPTDNMFVACALEGRADCLVTGDRHLLALGDIHHGVRIMSAAQFAAELEHMVQAD
jgi:hypothetical protein